jgi:hypothetical protein
MVRVQQAVIEVLTADGPVRYDTVSEARDAAGPGETIVMGTVEVDVEAAYQVRDGGVPIGTFSTVAEANELLAATPGSTLHFVPA